MAEDNIPIIVIFGRPGSGKSTLANAAMKSIDNTKIVALDLDVCVPQWMRDNFAKGIYPTLEERKTFALIACDYVTAESNRRHSQAGGIKGVMVSFSFVNTDLRDVFRETFPNAIWVLMDVTDEIAKERIDAREGHFYKGTPSANSGKKEGDIPVDQKQNQGTDKNSEWNFAPVDFPHIKLDGTKEVDENARYLITKYQTIL